MVEYAVFHELETTKQDVLDCSYSSWYGIFKDHAVKSVIIKPLPQAFIRYLEEDSIVLGEECNMGAIEANSENEYSDWESEDDGKGEEEDKRSVKQARPDDLFPSLHQDLKNKISELGGSVAPKLNWSAPKDAAWMLVNNTMKCTTPSDVYLLLKSSSHVVHDLDYAFDDCKDKDDVKPAYELVLRKWIDINPALEFRVFVRNRSIIGMCQRDLNRYTFLDELQSTLSERIRHFFTHTVKSSSFGPANYILDLYIPRPFSKVYITDINTLTRNSDSLLFTWNELLSGSADVAVLRLLTQHNVARFASKEHTESQVPLDVVAASANPNAMVELAMQWKDLQERNNA